MSDELIERLRAHDPERGTAAAPPPIERLLARIEAEEGPAPPAARRDGRSQRRAPLRRRPIAVAVALACLAAVALAAIVLGGSGDPRRDALTPAGDGRVIVHVVSRTISLNAGGRQGGPVLSGRGRRRIGTMDGPVERWIADAPRRWRVRTTFLPGRGMPGGTSEEAFADGVTRMRQSWEGMVRTMRPPAAAGDGVPFGVVFAGPQGAGHHLLAGVEDPRATVAEMLASGEARAVGALRRGGRRLLRFVGETPSQQLDRGSMRPATRATYLIDAETYAPVEARTAMALPRDGARGGPLGRFHPSALVVFDRYENLPLNAGTAPLLRFGGPTG